MKIKLVSNKESYGFQGKLWAKGDCVEIDKSEEYPKDHFDIIKGHDEPKDVLIAGHVPDIKPAKPIRKK